MGNSITENVWLNDQPFTFLHKYIKIFIHTHTHTQMQRVTTIYGYFHLVLFLLTLNEFNFIRMDFLCL